MPLKLGTPNSSGNHILKLGDLLIKMCIRDSLSIFAQHPVYLAATWIIVADAHAQAGIVLTDKLLDIDVYKRQQYTRTGGCRTGEQYLRSRFRILYGLCLLYTSSIRVTTGIKKDGSEAKR